MKKSLVIGASGLVGSYLYRKISTECQVIGTYQYYACDKLIHLDIRSKDAVKKIIFEAAPDFIFLPAAFTNVDVCEEKKKFCFEINVGGVRNIVDALKGTNIKLIYFSSDYIFNGKDGPYDEEFKPNPLGIYGKTKLDAERIIKKKMGDFLIIRTTCVYGWEAQEKNLVLNLIKKINLKEKMEMPVDQITTPTYAGSLSEIVWNLVKSGKKGIYNVAGNTLMSRLEFALLVADVFNLDRDYIIGVETEHMHRKARRPLRGGLKVDKIKEDLGLNIYDTKTDLLRMKKEKTNGCY